MEHAQDGRRHANENGGVDGPSMSSAGQILLRVRYLSLDPYMRGRMDDRKSYAKPVPLGGVMKSESVAAVIASKHPAYAEGDAVLATGGNERTLCLLFFADKGKSSKSVRKLPLSGG